MHSRRWTTRMAKGTARRRAERKGRREEGRREVGRKGEGEDGRKSAYISIYFLFLGLRLEVVGGAAALT